MKQDSPLLREHIASGRYFQAGDLLSFVREEGHGDPVVCLHGVPASSYLYRKLLGELALRGMRGIAFDFPGMGLADKPKQFDYSWTGLGRWVEKAIDALELECFHLVIHDIGGPVGLEFVARHPARLLSLTILNAPLAGVSRFKKPWVMRPFEKKRVGELYLGTLTPRLFTQLMYLQGVNDRKAASPDALSVYVELLKRKDGGKAFLQIMRGFEPTENKESLYRGAVQALEVPVQVLWGALDPALTLTQYGLPLKDWVGEDNFHSLPAKHFLQEDQAPTLAEWIYKLAHRGAKR